MLPTVNQNITPSHFDMAENAKNPLEVFEIKLSKSQFSAIKSLLPPGFLLQMYSPKRESSARPRKVTLINDKSVKSVSSHQDDESLGSPSRKSARNRKQAMKIRLSEYETPATSSKNYKLNFEGSQKCLNILNLLKSHDSSEPFLQPVDVEGLGLDDYYDIIKEPMDLSTIESKIKKGEYLNFNQFVKDVRKIWTNAFKYNQKGSGIYRMTTEMSQYFERLIRGMDNLSSTDSIRVIDRRPDANPKKINEASNSKGFSSTKRIKGSSNILKLMTTNEKRALGQNIRCLSPDQLRGVWDIVSKVLPHHDNKEELEFDIDSLPLKIARDLEKYVSAKIAQMKKKNIKDEKNQEQQNKLDEVKFSDRYLEEIGHSDSKAPTVDERKNDEDDDEFNSSESSFLSGNNY